jgi:hypothetical protein
VAGGRCLAGSIKRKEKVMEAVRIKCGAIVPKGYKGDYCPKCIEERKGKR